MGTISGNIVARCKECNCRYVWSMDNHPFVDSEVIGTCSDCFNKKSHDCHDEYTDHENGGFLFTGRKKFKKSKNKITILVNSNLNSEELKLELSKFPIIFPKDTKVVDVFEST